MNWKKIGLTMLIGVVVLMLVACGNKSENTNTDQAQEEQYTDWEDWESHELFGQVPVYVYEGQREEPHEEEGGYAMTVHGAGVTDCDAYLQLLQENGWQPEGGDAAAHNHVLKKDHLVVSFSYVEQDDTIVISVKQAS